MNCKNNHKISHAINSLSGFILVSFIILIGIAYTPIAYAQDDCNSCHNIDINAMSAGIHGSINNASISDIYPACNSCHVNGATRTCEYCHVKNSEDPAPNNAPTITEHRSDANDLKTNASCINCHINSVNSNPIYDNNYQRVAHYGTTTNLMTSINRSVNCKWCHITNNGNTTWGAPTDPRNLQSLDHNEFISSDITSNQECYNCHSNGAIPNNFHNASLNKKADGGKDCISCHEINAFIGKLLTIDVTAMNTSKNIHYDLNRQAASTTTLNPNNARCWACHGDGNGTEADQPDGHPINYKTPRNCNNNDCHALNQSIFGEIMVYEHFKNTNNTDQDIETSVNCEVCHSNSLLNNNDDKIKSESALVSHYGSTNDLIKSSSCTYCHLNNDNGEEWGDAPDPTDNATTLSDTEINKTLHMGENWQISSKYRFYFKDISKNGENAHIQILYNDEIINETIVRHNDYFAYTVDVIDKEGDEIESAIISINVTAVFRGQENSHENSIITIEGRIMKRIHSESTDESCYICHINNYNKDKSRYLVLDKDDDNTYYTKLYANFEEDEIKNKLLTQSIGKEIAIPEDYNQTWTLDGFELFVRDINIDGDSAYINLKFNNITVIDTVYNVGETIEYKEDLKVDNHTMNNTTIFRADVDKVFHGMEADAVILTNAKIISNKPEFIDNDDKIGRYNVSWLHIDDVFNIGGTPDNLHSPLINDGVDGGPDCLLCHAATSPVNAPVIDITYMELGIHNTLNAGEISVDTLTHNASKACWACHGNGAKPLEHYREPPKDCDDCHRTGGFGAIDLSDVPHGKGTVCQSCHGTTHNVQPLIGKIMIDYKILSNDIVKGETLNLSIIATAGWGMNIEAIEYFIDYEGNETTRGIGMSPQYGSFDSQVESAHVAINTTNMEYGSHTIYVRAKERNRWSNFKEIKMNVAKPNDQKSVISWNFFPVNTKPILFTLFSLTLLVMTYRFRIRYSKHEHL